LQMLRRGLAPALAVFALAGLALVPPATAVAPQIRGFAESNHIWREPGTPRHGHTPVGTTFTFTLSAPAELYFDFECTSNGRHHTCSQPHCPPHSKCRGPLIEIFRRPAGAGSVTEQFAGHIRHLGRLHPGRYNVWVQAQTPYDGGSSSPTLTLTIVR
jgi:hypothetical protein